MQFEIFHDQLKTVVSAVLLFNARYSQISLYFTDGLYMLPLSSLDETEVVNFHKTKHIPCRKICLQVAKMVQNASH